MTYGILVIDIQPWWLGFAQSGAAERLTENVSRFLRHPATASFPAIGVYYEGQWGGVSTVLESEKEYLHVNWSAVEEHYRTVETALALHKHTKVVRSKDNNAFLESSLELRMSEADVDHWILAGMMSTACVYATAQHAHLRNFSLVSCPELLFPRPSKARDPDWGKEVFKWYRKHTNYHPTLSGLLEKLK